MNKTCDIVYRVDGGRNLGYGHIFRSISIENDLKNYFKFKFLVIKDKAGFNFLKKKIKNVKLINYKNESLEIFRLQPKLVIFDTLYLKKDILEKLRLNGIKIIVFEDIYEKSKEFSNYIINAVVNGPKNKKTKIKHGYKLQGSNYKIIHKFNKKFINRKKDNMFTLSLGGGEPKKGIIIKIFKKIYPILNKLKIKINIILGSGITKETSNYFDKVRNNYKGINIFKKRNNIYDILSRSKFLLTSGGGTIYEAALFGVVLFLYPLKKHQKSNSKHFHNQGYGKIIKKMNNKYLSKLLYTTTQNEKYILNQIKIGKKIFPYKNNDKVLSIISNCLKKNIIFN